MNKQKRRNSKSKTMFQTRSPRLYFNEKEERKMAEDYLNLGKTMTTICTKYTGRIDGQYQIKR